MLLKSKNAFLSRWPAFLSPAPFHRQIMVKLSLSSPKGLSPASMSFFSSADCDIGNSGLRYFPCSGYLGLTPVRIDGGTFSSRCLNPFFLSDQFLVVRTRLEDDQKVLQAKSITISVRCYETRTKVGSNSTNVLVDYTQVLWSKADAVEYQAIGNLEFPFRLSIPPKVAGFSNATFIDYKCIWRIEAGTFSCFITCLSSIDMQSSQCSIIFQYLVSVADKSDISISALCVMMSPHGYQSNPNLGQRWICKPTNLALRN